MTSRRARRSLADTTGTQSVEKVNVDSCAKKRAVSCFDEKGKNKGKVETDLIDSDRGIEFFDEEKLDDRIILDDDDIVENEEVEEEDPVDEHFAEEENDEDIEAFSPCNWKGLDHTDHPS